MLSGGLITCIITFIRQDSVLKKLGSLFVVFLVMYFAGTLLVWTLNRFDKENAPVESTEDVIEKEGEEPADGVVVSSQTN